MARTMDRRAFIRTASGTVIAVSMADFLAACGSSSDSKQGDADTAKTLLIADIIDIAPIDPAQYSHTIGRTMLRNVYEPLTYYKLGEYTLEPRLATEWERSSNGLQYTVKLRDGVKFHNDAPFSADDVKATFDRVLAIGQNVPTASLSGSLKSTEVVDASTVKFTLTYPYAFFMEVLPKIPIVSAKDIKEHEVKDDWANAWFLENANGTGPYKLDQWNKGRNYTLGRNTSWWGEHPGGAYERVYMQVITDGTQQREMLERGRLNLTSDWISVFTKIAAADTAPDRVKLVDSKGLMQLLVIQNAAAPPLDNKLVRQAVAAAFPYERMRDYYKGHASLPLGSFASDYPGIDASANEPLTQNLEQARGLLSRAGHPDGGFKLQFFFDQGSEEKRQAGILFQGALKEVGVDLAVTDVPGATWTEQGANPKTAGHFNPHYEAPETPDPFQWVNKMFGKEGYLNWSHVTTPSIDNAIKEGQNTTDEDRRNELLNDTIRIVAEEGLAFPASRFDILHAMSTSVEGYIFDQLDLQGVPKFWTMHT